MLDYFSKHKRVSGTISILLTLLLLPIYSVIALLIESARYQSAKQQLDELTYLGELAILSDYVLFLEEHYDLYAFYNPNNGSGESIAAKSFQDYIASAKTAGGIDTTSLNKLLGIPLESCDIKGMYTLADPKVLEYQIKQSGRYMMPADILADLSLNVLFKDINEKFNKINNKLTLIGAVADEMEDTSKILVTINDLNTSSDKLTAKLGEYNNQRSDFITKKNSVTNWDVDEETYNLVVKNGYDDNAAQLDTQRKTKLERFYRVISKPEYKQIIKKYEILSDEYEDISELPDYDGKEENLLNKIKEINDLKVDVDSSDEDVLFFSGEISAEDYISQVTDLINRDGDYIQAAGYSVNLYTLSGYENVLESIDSEITQIKTVLEKYENYKKTAQAIASYNDLCSIINDDDGLTSRYYTYTNSLINLLKDLTNVISNYYKIEAAELASDIDDLNDASKTASEKISEYEAMMNEKEKEIDPNNKNSTSAQKNKAIANRKSNYKDAKAVKNYAKLGENVAEKFTAEVTESNIVEWRNNYTSYVSSFSPVSNSDYSSYVASINHVKSFTPKENIIIEYNGIVSPDINDQEAQVVASYIASMQAKAELAKELGWDIPENEQEELLSNEILGKLYSPLLNSDDDYIDQDWFSFSAYSSGSSFYLSKSMTMMLVGFLGAQAYVEGSKDNGILDMIKMLVDAFKDLSPADAALNSHVKCELGSNRDNEKLSDVSTSFPSGQNKFGLIQNENGEKAKAYNYATEVIGTKSGRSVNVLNMENGSDYYLNANPNSDDLYISVFGNRQPGKSIATIVSAASDAFGAIDSFLRSIIPPNIIRILISIFDFCKGIIELVIGLIEFVVDIVTIVDQLVNNTEKAFVYLFDQFYIAYYISNHFTSRQTSPEGHKFKYDLHCQYSWTGDTKECEINKTFKGAQMEYILCGNNCEVTNQRNTYFALFALRYLLNYTVVSSNGVVTGLSAIPIVGPFMPFIADYIETKTDIMFMLLGYNIPVIKDKVLIVSLCEKFKDKKTRDELKGMIKTALTDAEPDSRNRLGTNKRFKWTMEKDSYGRKHRKYSGAETITKKLNSNIESATGLKKSSDMIVKSNGKIVVQFNYEQYINLLLAFYPADEKVLRMADIIQMEGMHDGAQSGDFNYDSGFRMSDTYTYLFADVQCRFATFLPLLSNGSSWGTIKVKNVQMNGY